MNKDRSNSETIAASIVEYVIVRILYFIGAFAILAAGSFRTPWLWIEPGFWAFVVIASVVAALFGPGIYKKEVERGRGSLKDVKAKSRYRD